MQVIKQVVNAGQRVLIIDGDPVKDPVVNARAQPALLLPDKQDWRPIR